MKKVALFAAVVVIVCAVVGVLTGCGSPEAKRAEAASTYAAQQADCIASKKTRAEIDACRDDVKANWAKRDAGAEGGTP